MISKLLNVIVLLFLQYCFVLTAFAQQQSGVYNWPLKPGMPEWKDLKTHDEMLEVLQIPVEILQKMTTKDLAQTCLNYPLFPDIWAFNSLQDGMERVIAGFNGLQELLKRDDAGLELYAIYKTMDPHNFEESWSDLQKGQYTAEFAKIEILLAQEAILSSLKQNERLLLLQESVNKQNAMQQFPIYDRRNQEPNAYLIGKIMQKDYPDIINQASKDKPNLQAFLQRGSMASKDTIANSIKAVPPNSGWSFYCWSDGSFANPRTITQTLDIYAIYKGIHKSNTTTAWDVRSVKKPDCLKIYLDFTPHCIYYVRN